jgi:hypothetical protein
MNKYTIIIFLLLFFNYSFSQVLPESIWENVCDYKTDGTGKSKGVKLKISYPCDFVQKDGDRPHVVKKFVFNKNDNGFGIYFSIDSLPTKPTNSELEDMFSEEGAKQYFLQLANGLKQQGIDATFISGRKTRIDGINCIEVIYKGTGETNVARFKQYVLYYLIPYKNKFINLIYSIGSQNESSVEEVFLDSLIYLKVLASKTVILSKWEK